jgi:histidinol-phosphate aminotransferase
MSTDNPSTARLQRALQHTIRSDIQGAGAYAVQPSAGMIKLDAMENPHRLCEALQRELGERLGQVALNRYPLGKAELAARLSQHFAVPQGCAMMLGNGSDELIDILSLACSRPNAAILSPVPTFVMYAISAQYRGLRFVGVPTTERFELDETAMLQAIKRERPALTYIAYPNNPTANLFDEKVVARLVQAVGEQEGLVVMDEAYQPFSSRTWLPKLSQDDQSHVLVLRTLSKFGLAGVRLGYLVGHKALIDQIDKCSPPYNLSSLNIEAAHFALDHAPVFEAQAQLIQQERGELIKALAALPGVTAFPSDANMIVVRVPDSARAFEGMKQRGVLVKHVAGMHPLMANTLRITVGTHEENTAMMVALKAALSSKPTQPSLS